MSLSICNDFNTYNTLEWFTLTLATSTPCLIFTFITFSTNHFCSFEKVYKEYCFKIWHIKMNQQNYTGYIHSTSEQAQSQNELLQSQSEQVQSHGHVQFGGGQA